MLPSPDPFTIRRGDALELLRHVASETVDAVIVDPPYSSGGFTRGDRSQTPAQKYQTDGTARTFATFDGDSRDARSFRYWFQLWGSECLRIVRPSGYFCTFTDWRQLPTMTDALQAAGFVMRGIVTWDKGGAARAPHTGYFRHQAEFMVWGTKGVSRPAAHGGPFPGVYRFPVLQRDKHHVTGKPTDLLRELVKVVPPGGVVMDPMMGSGTAGAAAMLEGRRFIGFEQSPDYFATAEGRIIDAAIVADRAARAGRVGAMTAAAAAA